MAVSPEDLGAQIAYPALRDGTPVFDREGRRIGVIDRVMETGGIFEGVIVHTHPLPGRHLYADAEQVAQIHERGVLLSVTRDELHDPARESRPRDPDRPESPLEARLRHAWDWLTRPL